ncbi:hypothetical protein F3Y22_tig00110204pilonHSYRG00048 [Hibiscus syriacus]|uniref:PDZ domain-containing protein n=1 Tax=Hibiscus syriacus TaxID=106335 RepID=A0A6A3BFL8_HIBSY|nr:hypothetical protein F3Y22_tig00110204pilonHSYRG00048 [Hibiscus syriacus]
MALVPTTYPHLCSNSYPPSPRAIQPLLSPSMHVGVRFRNKCWPLFSGKAKELKPCVLVVKASESESQTQTTNQEEEEYEVEIEQPYGLKFRKGRDGGTYIDAILPGGAADKAGVFTVGDRVLATSAVFGTEIWPAAEYGRTMYTIRQRIGPLLMKMQKRYGQVDEGGELTEKEIIRAERNSGVISNRVREIQMQNYIRKREENKAEKGISVKVCNYTGVENTSKLWRNSSLFWDQSQILMKQP